MVTHIRNFLHIAVILCYISTDVCLYCTLHKRATATLLLFTCLLYTSFQDTNGDGIGDLKGVTAHLDDLADLGINVIWLCPINKSPMKDHGYDISDYEEIDPMFGCKDDLVELIQEADKHGIKILMDLVVNHTSVEHPWFQKALAEPNGKYGKY